MLLILKKNTLKSIVLKPITLYLKTNKGTNHEVKNF